MADKVQRILEDVLQESIYLVKKPTSPSTPP